MAWSDYNIQEILNSTWTESMSIGEYFEDAICDFHGAQVLWIASKRTRAEADVPIILGSHQKLLPLIRILHPGFGSKWEPLGCEYGFCEGEEVLCEDKVTSYYFERGEEMLIYNAVLIGRKPCM